MTEVAIYARVSSERQKQEHTIASQTEALQDYAASKGWVVAPEWIFEDEGVSGATLLRPALEKLRDLVAQGLVEMILCHSPDRLARKYAYQVLLLEEFAKAGTEVQFLKGPSSDSAEDELLLQFQGMIAEYERAQISERNRRGKIHRARSGQINVLSGAPYGYRYIRKSEACDARYEIDEAQAVIVRQIFGRYVEEQVSIGELARWLTQGGILTAKGRQRWDRSTVWAILRNPAYAGRAAYGKTQLTAQQPRITRPMRLQGISVPRHPARGDRPSKDWISIPVPAIVSEETFALAGERLASNRRFARRRTKEPSPFTRADLLPRLRLRLLPVFDPHQESQALLLSMPGQR